jgi:hypothetical protein
MSSRFKPAVRVSVSLVVLTVLALPALSQERRSQYGATQGASWTVPEGTVIHVRMTRTLSSKTARVGDKFTATVTIPVYVSGTPVIPAGALIEGRLTQVTPAKRMSKPGTMAVEFDALVLPDGTRVKMAGDLTSDDPDIQRRIDEEGQVSGKNSKRPGVFVGGGGAIGAVIGGVVGGGKGAVIGGVAGAGAGVAGVLLSKGEEAEVPAGVPFGVQLRQPLLIRSDRAQQTVARTRPAPTPTDPVESRPRISNPETTERPGASRPAEERPVEPELPLSSPEMVRRAQTALKEQGYYEGQIDGIMGPRTASALRSFQRENKLPETGDLDPATAKALGIVGSGARPVADARSAGAGQDHPEPAEEVVLAHVLNATAARASDGSISVAIHTQANSGGWRWFEDHFVNGDTLEVYARAVKPVGPVTQALTRGRIDLTVTDGVQYVRRVVVHGEGGDLTLALASASSPARPTVGAASAVSIQRQAEELLSECQRLIGVRLTGTSIEVDSRAQPGEAEVELLFSIDAFANAAQLYARLTPSLSDRQSSRMAALSLAREARRADRIFTTSSSPAATTLATRWDAIRQDVLRLMQTHGISSADLDN